MRNLPKLHFMVITSLTVVGACYRYSSVRDDCVVNFECDDGRDECLDEDGWRHELCLPTAQGYWKQGKIADALAMWRMGCEKVSRGHCVDMVLTIRDDIARSPKPLLSALEFACKAPTTRVGCVTLGDLYAEGKHVPRDFAKAAAYYEQACTAEGSLLYYYSYNVVSNMLGAEDDYAWWRDDGAALRGCDEAKRLYESGLARESEPDRVEVLVARRAALLEQLEDDRVAFALFLENMDRTAAEAEAARQEAWQSAGTALSNAGQSWSQGQLATGLPPEPSSAANRSSGQAGATGPAAEPCAPCKEMVKVMNDGCRSDAQSPSCYRAAAEMHRCTAKAPGCSRDPAWSEAEARRMDQAAADAAP